MMENPFEEINKLQRPTFLFVLCILTFIGSGWNVLSNLFSLFTAGMMDSTLQMEQYSNIMENMENGATSAFMSGLFSSSMQLLQSTAVHAREITALQLSLAVVSLLGAILMFQLRRLGFYLYAAAQILTLFILPYFAGFSLVVMIGLLWSGFITLIFIILYAVNLKYMVR